MSFQKNALVAGEEDIQALTHSLRFNYLSRKIFKSNFFSIARCLENECAISGQMQYLLIARNMVLLRKLLSLLRIPPLVYQGGC